MWRGDGVALGWRWPPRCALELPLLTRAVSTPVSASASAPASAPAGYARAAALVAAAEREATAWYAANAEVYRLGGAANYAAERSMVIGTGAGSSLAGYDALEHDIAQAIVNDQAVFGSAATSGAHALDPLEPVVIATSLLMALLCAWGLSRRIAEYR